MNRQCGIRSSACRQQIRAPGRSEWFFGQLAKVFRGSLFSVFFSFSFKISACVGARPSSRDRSVMRELSRRGVDGTLFLNTLLLKSVAFIAKIFPRLLRRSRSCFRPNISHRADIQLNQPERRKSRIQSTSDFISKEPFFTSR